MKRLHAGRLAATGAALAVMAAGQALALPPITTQATLLDRVQIEDLLIAYYQPLGGSGGEDFASFYTADGVLDINGRVYQGPKGIAQAYKDARAARSPDFKGRFHMLLTNPRIVVHGQTATADAIWTGITSETLAEHPRFIEQGREHDELVKQNGRWLLKKRLITSDGGLTPFYQQTYKER